MGWFSRLFGGTRNRCSCIDEDGRTCLERQKGQVHMVTCDYCYAVGNNLIKKGEEW